jgi:hypothetical protein
MKIDQTSRIVRLKNLEWRPIFPHSTLPLTNGSLLEVRAVLAKLRLRVELLSVLLAHVIAFFLYRRILRQTLVMYSNGILDGKLFPFNRSRIFGRWNFLRSWNLPMTFV